MTGKYKVNQEIEFDYEPKQKGFVVGSIVNFDDKGKLIAKGEVLESNKDKFKVKILVTYGHKRRKDNSVSS